MDPTSRSTTSHIRESVNPYVSQDLKGASPVRLYQWIEVITKVSPKKFKAWTTTIWKEKWFEDAVIADAYVDYCKCGSEKGRYTPFVAICNRILALARGRLEGVPATSSYPVDDLCFLDHNAQAVATIAEHGDLGALRRPDIVVVCRSVAQALARGKQIEWWNILYPWELKWVMTLIEKLNKARVARGMSALDLDTGLPLPRRVATPEKMPTTRAARKSTRKPTAAPNTRVSTPTTAPATRKLPQPTTTASKSKKTGKKPVIAETSLPHCLKRKREVEDLVNGLSVKRNRGQDSQDPANDAVAGANGAVQLGSYALELLSCTYGARIYCIGSVLKDDRLFLWFYDASGIVYTIEFVSIIDDFEQFAALIVALARCTPEQLGLMPEGIMSSPTVRPNPFAFSPRPYSLARRVFSLRLQDATGAVTAVRVRLKRHRFSHYVVLGRRTSVYDATTSPQQGEGRLIVKVSYQASGRTPEQDLVSIARAAGVDHLPEIYVWGDLWHLSEGVREAFHQQSHKQVEYEDRTLRAIVYKHYGSIKTLFKTRLDLIPVMADQIIDCLHDLRYKAGILHRDVSVNNIMFEVRDGKYYFILIDYDMGVLVSGAQGGSYKASSKHRTGTLPFMACELIMDAWEALESTESWAYIPHLLCHDLQSVFWVALWCTQALETLRLSPELQKKLLGRAKSWEVGTLRAIHGIKFGIYSGREAITLPPAARRLGPWFTAWLDLFSKAESAMTDRLRAYNEAQPLLEIASDDGSDIDAPLDIRRGTSSVLVEWDAETIGGTFTRDTIKAALARRVRATQGEVREGDPDICEEEEDEKDEEEGKNQCETNQGKEAQLGKSTADCEVETKEQAKKQTCGSRPQKSRKLEVFSDMRARLRPRKK